MSFTDRSVRVSPVHFGFETIRNPSDVPIPDMTHVGTIMQGLGVNSVWPGDGGEPSFAPINSPQNGRDEIGGKSIRIPQALNKTALATGCPSCLRR